MKRTRSALDLGRSIASVAIGSAFLAACGAGTGALSASTALSGVAFSNAAISNGAVTLTDASATAQRRQATTAADGSFTVDVSGLTPPYALQVAWTGAGSRRTLHAVTDGSGAADINPLTDLAVAYALGADDPELLASTSPGERRAIAAEVNAVLTDLTAEVAPVLNACGVRSLGRHEGDARKLLEGLEVSVSSDTLTLRNPQTGGTVLTVALDGMRCGSFDPSQLPTTGPCGGFDPGALPSTAFPGGLDPGHLPSTIGTPSGAALYAARCASCHGALGVSQHLGATAAQILTRHGSLVTSTEAAAIADALSHPASGSSSSGAASSSGATSSSGGTSSSGATSSSSGGTSGGTVSPVPPGHIVNPPGASCTACHSGRGGAKPPAGSSGGTPAPGSSGGTTSSSGGTTSGGTTSSSGGTTSGGTASSSGGTTSGGTASSSGGTSSALPAWHPTIPSGASCTSCHK